ncbi:DNA-binding protein [Agrobacterium rhizogenes]|nr:DNA-binding protein [Rhizobium rhizogenes]NTH70506.1 DNA-binding protein [Rhizobium rhizogenes]
MNQKDIPPLDRWRLDAMLKESRTDGNRRPGANNPSRIIWTLPAIGQRIGVGADFVRDTLAKQPRSPIKELGGRFYAFEDDLIAFLRSKD